MYLFLRNNLNRIMKSYLSLILVFSLSINLFAPKPGQPNMSLRDLKQNFDITQLSDSLLGTFTIDKSTKLVKNLDATIDNYSIVNLSNDTIIVDTSLTMDKYYKLNYLRKDNLELIEFSNTGHTYNKLSFYQSNNLLPEFGSEAKHYNYMQPNDINYYHVATPFTEPNVSNSFCSGAIVGCFIFCQHISKV